MNKRRLFNKYDFPVFAAVIIIAAVIYIFTGLEKGAVCEIKIDGKILHAIILSGHERDFELPENPNIKFKIKDNAIAFISSDCPDKICVNTGWLRYSGQTAVCMPNRVSIHVTGNNGADIIIN